MSPVGRFTARAARNRVTPRRLARHAAAATLPDPSYACEWPHLRAVLTRLDLLREGFAVDLAAGDGVTSSCTLPLFRDHGWSGVAIECDDVAFTLLEHSHGVFDRVTLARRRITPSNVVRSLTALGVPTEFTVLNLDLDSYDLAVASGIMTRFRPIVVDIEINEKVPPPIRFRVNYTHDFRWDEGHCYGCSLSAAQDVLGAAGYRLEGLEYNNAFFVREDVAAARGIEAVSAERAYREGYIERPDRPLWFPWNREMEPAMMAEPATALAFIERRFRRARASYALQLNPFAADGSSAR